MILIADSGSTKTDWVVADGENRIWQHSSSGLNPVLLAESELQSKLREALTELDVTSVDAIRFYGAGCLPEMCGRVRNALSELTGCTDIEVCSDMMGAARALCGYDPGIVAILGTGSNTCQYDGEKIVANTPPLGYILGDEGSGARLGIALVNGVLKGYLPEHIREAFYQITGLDKMAIIDRVYRRPGANTFLASLTRFISQHISDESISTLVVSEFTLFFERNIVHAYPDALPVHFVGSIAKVFEAQLRVAAEASGFRVGRIEARPLESLVRYHSNTVVL